jgi:hypothetical protein
MPIQIATTAQLDNAQRIVIAEVRFTAEHSAPCPNLVEKFTLGEGEKQITVPRVAQMEADNLTDGQDITTSKAIGMTTVDLTTGEVGLKCILTDKLLRQSQPDLFRVIGRQMGDAMARKLDKDIIALFPALNSSTTLGVADCTWTMAKLGGYMAFAKNKKFPKPISIVHHPYSIMDLVAAMTLTPSITYPMPHGYSEDLLKDFWKMTVNGIPLFEDGNITPNGSDDAVGAIFSREAMCLVESLAPRTERERDASLRAWEVVVVADYGCFELNDAAGAPITIDASAPADLYTS